MQRTRHNPSKSPIWRVVLLAFTLGLVSPWVAPAPAEAAEGDAIVLIHSNDVHCGGIATSEEAIGYAGIAQAAATARETYGTGNVTLVDAGDAIQGQPIGLLSKGVDLVDLMDAAGYDVAVPGNHEFDYGIEQLQTLAKDDADYPYVSCNVVNTETGEPLFDPYEILDYTVGGETVRVAYVGITTPTTLTSEQPSIFQNASGETVWSFYGEDDGRALYAQVQSSVDAARAEGADYVIAVAHLGKDASSSVPECYTSTAVVRNTTGIDGVIDGHTHLVYSVELPNRDGEMVHVAQCGTQFQAYGTMTITPDDDPGPEDVASSVTVAADLAEPVPQDATVADAVQAKQDAFAEELEKEVGTSEAGLSVYSPNDQGDPFWWTARMRETNLGDFVADAYRDFLDADVAFVNGGGIRAPQTAIAPMANGTFGFAAGPVSYGTLMSINSFGNPVSLVKVTGQDLLDALEYSVRKLTPAMDDETESTGSFLQVSGIQFKAAVDIPSPVIENADGGFDHVVGGMTRRVSDVFVGDEPIDAAKTYTLASIPILLSGSGDYTMFGDCEYVVQDAGTDYQILAEYLQSTLEGTITENLYGDPAGAGRIDIVTEGSPESQTVGVYRLYNPYSGAHLYTADLNEVQTLVGLGWKSEGLRFSEYNPTDELYGTTELAPVYRLYNKFNDDHFYTSSVEEIRELMLIDMQNGWVSEGIAWYAPHTSDVPVHRLYNPYMTADGGFGNHLWTALENEAESLEGLGWLGEGIGWYALGR